MSERHYCARCLEPVFRPGQVLDSEGVCRPCRYAETHDAIDWDERRRQLDRLVAETKAAAEGPYDCLIGVSGGKDSLRQAIIARDELGLKPLLVCCSYPPEQASDRGQRNLSNLVSEGFDLHYVSPGPRTWKQMMRIAFLEQAQWTRPTELALFCSVVKTATTMQIPLAILGENPALAFGAEAGTQDADAAGFRSYDTLRDGSVDSWVAKGISRNRLFWYDIPDAETCAKLKLRMIYIGYFFRDFHDVANTEFAKSRRFHPRTGKMADPAYTGSLNPYESVDEDFVHLNQYLKSVKLGFGKVIQQVSVYVRYGGMSRDEAVELALKYDGILDDELIDQFCRYLEIDRATFDEVENRIRNKEIWRLNNEGRWEHRHPPTTELIEERGRSASAAAGPAGAKRS
ncbi:MAG: N-acetyl sugar amidotransferase [Alphaproteobacteria bacterium]|nr:N-acetyl sugar amidotransferase [Alphaproteobacteria bacterium]